jgi:DNA-binding MarR family transcriptional regulator
MVQALNKSVQEVFNTISDKRVKVRDIEKRTKYSPRTVRHALRTLLDLGLITQIPDLSDLRSHFYSHRI